MSVTSYVVVKNWRKFQHYGDDRRPVWIKNYVALLDDPAYLGLTDVQRALLHGLWLWYAMAKTCVPLDLKMINRKLGLSVKMATIEALRDAGFIEFSASKSLVSRYQDASLEVEVEREEEKPSLNGHHPPLGTNGASGLRGEAELGFERADAIARLLAVLTDKDAGTEKRVWFYAAKLPAPTIHKVRESVLENRASIRSSVSGFAVNALKDEARELQEDVFGGNPV